MLLTLSAKSVWNADRTPGKGVAPADLPRWAREELGVYGLTLQTSLFTGWEIAQYDRFRDTADKAGAPCLVLIEDKPLGLAESDEGKAAAALDRAERVLRVAGRLGCSSVAISLDDSDQKGSIEALTPRLKRVLSQAERMELNLLLAPASGLTDTPEKLTSLIRKVGGFRIGSFPDFEAASKASNPTAYLRSLAPYATCVCAGVRSFDAKGVHKGYDLEEYLEAILSVGFEAALALEFRGKGDPIPTLRAAKAAIEAHVTPAAATDADDDDLNLEDAEAED
jgi:sugar phosphate isomerase/epimerase